MLTERGSKKKLKRLKRKSLRPKQRSLNPKLQRSKQLPKARLRQRLQKNLPSPRLRLRRLLMLEAKPVTVARALRIP